VSVTFLILCWIGLTLLSISRLSVGKLEKKDLIWVIPTAVSGTLYTADFIVNHWPHFSSSVPESNNTNSSYVTVTLARVDYISVGLAWARPVFLTLCAIGIIVGISFHLIPKIYDKIKSEKRPIEPEPRIREPMDVLWPKLVHKTMRNDIVARLVHLMNEWKTYERVEPPERWVSFSHDSMQKHASETANEIQRLISKQPNLWDAEQIEKLRAICEELQGFATVSHPYGKYAVEMDRHGMAAVKLTKALLPSLSAKCTWRAKLRL